MKTLKKEQTAVKMSLVSWNALPSSIYRLLKKPLLHPPYPWRAQTRPFPSLIFASRQSSTCRWEKSPFRPAQGRASERPWDTSGYCSPAVVIRKRSVWARPRRASVIIFLFEQSTTSTSNPPLTV
jgi:hypothetical protein